ncbi:LysR family transcriptional regulator [Lutimaribacter saemankumensis]|uniref:DNA-binding transcriptional regulator, LysR family n=1 Tax=Lutimaribacter saemankumensis TaxID=490829 RepID=A0A1G8QTP5_9RHOB|nr:LysR family transcriptional regulator [Lutimaribacter saemankumensis]SDJ08129.1 DNA-binding transcriptional regulator, LysR family [Lutimaribacter saemankumensis]
MNIEMIETFLDLCETRSFHQTASRLGVTQSTVSGRVSALERALGCRLLARSRSGTELTTEGLRFEPYARSLRLNWTTARQDVRGAGRAALTMRIGIQHDLLGDQAAGWVSALQNAVPEAALYVEADYSTQMCSDVMNGQLDLAIHFTPKAHPDLYFETLGEVGYHMVSTEARMLTDVSPDTYILANFAPAFSTTHAALLPSLSGGAVSSGQNAVIRALLTALGGSGYVLWQTATELERNGQAYRVAGAPRIAQPVYVAVHLRNRHRSAHRRLLRALKAHLGARDTVPGQPA